MRLVALCLLLCGCSHSPELTIVAGLRRVDGDTSPGACLVLKQQFAKHVGATYVHCSDPTAGKPFNRDWDVSDDVLGVSVTFGGK